MKYFLILSAFLLGSLALVAQSQTGYTKINGQYYPYVVDDCGDTLIVAELSNISVSSPEAFDSEEDYKLYRRYRLYAQQVYPYAIDAIRIFRETEYITQNMSKKERKRYVRRLQKELLPFAFLLQRQCSEHVP